MKPHLSGKHFSYEHVIYRQVDSIEKSKDPQPNALNYKLICLTYLLIVAGRQDKHGHSTQEAKSLRNIGDSFSIVTVHNNEANNGSNNASKAEDSATEVDFNGVIGERKF